MNTAVYKLRELAKIAAGNCLRKFGPRLLDGAAMPGGLPAHCVLPVAETMRVHVPDAELLDPRCEPAREMAGSETEYGASVVYRLPKTDFPRMKVLPNGGVHLGKNTILMTGLAPERGSQVAALVPDRRRESRREKIIIAPFPHHWKMGTYGDFLVRLLPRICRVVDWMDAADRPGAVIAYPLFHGGYEKTLLERMGFPAERVIDTASVRVECAPGGVIYCPNGEPVVWPIKSSHPADYQSTRRLLKVEATKLPEKGRRLYLQRVGRRRILNEAELLPLLAAHGFETVDLGDYSFAEQITMCGKAAVMLGIQGANLTNMLWCAPGATIVELLGRGFRPNFHRMMAQSLGLEYRYWAETPMAPSDFANVNWDMTCDVGALKSYLEREWS